MADNLLASAGVSAGTVAVLVLAVKLVSSFCGHQYVSQCCERRLHFGITVRDMPPTPPAPLETQTRRLSLMAPSPASAENPAVSIQVSLSSPEVKESGSSLPTHQPPTTAVVGNSPAHSVPSSVEPTKSGS